MLFIIAPVFLEKPISNLDELWNYNFASNIANGLIPYRDFNMLQTPLLPFIAGFILKLFSNELIVMRILGILFITFLFYLIYRIFKLLKINSFFSFFSLFLIFILLKDYLCIDYNFLVLIFTLLIIYLEIKYYLKNNKKILSFYFFENLSIGILAGCSILLKQSTGLLISIIAVGFKILMVKNKNDFKLFLKIFFARILGILIPILLFVIYLILNHALYDFTNYTILGIKTFSNKICYTVLINSNNIAIKILSIFIPVFIILSGFYIARKKEIISIILFFYSLGSLIVIYPIADNIHFLIGIIPTLLLLFYFIFNILKIIYNKMQNKFIIFIKELLRASIFLSFIIFSLFGLAKIMNYISLNKNIINFEHFNYITMPEEQLKRIHLVDSYMIDQNNPVYILDADAALYMIPINRYYKDFNLFLKGNLGSKGEDGQIEKINQLKTGSQILIKNDNYKRNWQTPEKVISYIKNNLNKIGEISLFDIYEI